MSYWWVSQGKNHVEAIRQGSLWTTVYRNGTFPEPRAAIKKLNRGDIVVHYKGPAVRAVSFVDETAVEAPRPPHYPRKPGDSDHGWLVHVVPVATDLYLSFEDAGWIVHHGTPGPLNLDGMPGERYLSRLTDDEGDRLLERLGVSMPALPTDETDDSSGDEPTDGQALVSIRREQKRLRRYLLRGLTEAPCALCGRVLPERLLVAAHIKRRSSCTNAERLNLASSAMLACSLGCDVLYEWGYVTVGHDGLIAAGRLASTTAVAQAVEALTGRPCSAFDDHRAERFAAHASMHHTGAAVPA